MKKHALFIATALLMFTLQGCGKAVPPAAPEITPPVEPVTSTTTTEPAVPEIDSLLNGLPMDDGLINRRPIAVMLDNQAQARPQAGLSEADVVIEALAEGQITRYMAIFQSTDPETIGPVRSARPYFIDKAMEYDAYYVHAGGSMQALSDLVKKGVADLDALHEGKVTFWRKGHKKAPHNLYTSPEALRNAASARKYKDGWNGLPQTFSNEGTPSGGTPFTQVFLHYKEPGKGDSTGYIPCFTASAEEQRLLRSVNGNAHQDETTKESLYAENLIIQIAVHRTIDSEGRLDVGLIGSGAGFYCREGRYWPITWEKENPESPTTYKLEDDSLLLMKPGKVWIEIFPTKKTIEFK